MINGFFKRPYLVEKFPDLSMTLEKNLLFPEFSLIWTGLPLQNEDKISVWSKQ